MKKQMMGLMALLVVMGVAAGVDAAQSKKKELVGVVNVNEAGVAELSMLPGIGVKRAKEIQDYAKSHPFKSVDELVNIKGIGPKSLASLKPFVSVSGPTTAKLVEKSASLAP